MVTSVARCFGPVAQEIIIGAEGGRTITAIKTRVKRGETATNVSNMTFNCFVKFVKKRGTKTTFVRQLLTTCRI